MATSKKFSELPAASSVGNGDLFAIAHEDALAETGYVSQKLTAAQAGQKVNGDTEYPTGLPSFPENGQNPFAALEKLNADIDSLYPVNTASGSIANFTTSLAKPLVGLSSTIVAQQASGTPTPSNPLPISGWNSIELTHEYGESESETKTIALGQTVYGGSVDAKNGKLVITHDFKTFDGSSDENWFISSTNAYYGIEIGIDSMVANTVISNLFESIQEAPSSDHLGINNSSRYIRVRPTADTVDLQAFKTWLSNNNLQVCYELATPIEITGLTPANFTTIAGAQNIFSDCGDISVSFKQGIQEYIDAKIAETQALIL